MFGTRSYTEASKCLPMFHAAVSPLFFVLIESAQCDGSTLHVFVSILNVSFEASMSCVLGLGARVVRLVAWNLRLGAWSFGSERNVRVA